MSDKIRASQQLGDTPGSQEAPWIQNNYAQESGSVYAAAGSLGDLVNEPMGDEARTAPAPAAVPTSGCVISSTKCTLTNSGVRFGLT